MYHSRSHCMCLSASNTSQNYLKMISSHKNIMVNKVHIIFDFTSPNQRYVKQKKNYNLPSSLVWFFSSPLPLASELNFHTLLKFSFHSLPFFLYCKRKEGEVFCLLTFFSFSYQNQRQKNDLLPLQIFSHFLSLPFSSTMCTKHSKTYVFVQKGTEKKREAKKVREKL